jgi:hypothetical protein
LWHVASLTLLAKIPSELRLGVTREFG